MKGAAIDNGGVVSIGNSFSDKNETYTAKSGLTVKMINGEAFFSIDEVQLLLASEIQKLPKETRPAVLAAEDARKTIDALMTGIGKQMEDFKVLINTHRQELQHLRAAVNGDTSAMIKDIKLVQNCVSGGEYNREIEKLREFVDLGERLLKLKGLGLVEGLLCITHDGKPGCNV